MAYNLTRHSVQRNKPQLDQILASKRGVVRFYTNKPKELQRNIHEALAAAREFPEFRHYYDAIKNNYVIRVKKTYVLVEKKEEIEVTRVEDLGEDERFEVVRPVVKQQSPTEAQGEPLESRDPVPTNPRPETSDASSLTEILLIATQAGEDITDLIFPKAQLSLDEKRRLNEWCKEKEVNFIDQEERGITLTRRPVDPELTWREEENK